MLKVVLVVLLPYGHVSFCEKGAGITADAIEYGFVMDETVMCGEAAHWYIIHEYNVDHAR